MKKIPLIMIAGPTAVGKTKLSIDIAKYLDSEVISADSMQIYKGMDIGTAKVTIEEMQGVKHHLIDEVNPDFDYSVAEFQKKALSVIYKMKDQNKIPIIAGGTGLYLNSLIFNMDFTKSKKNSDLRLEFSNFADENPEKLYEKLLNLSPNAAKNIHPNNTKRIIRALEVIATTGKEMNDFSKDLTKNENFYPVLIILNKTRADLYDKINMRVDLMIKNGLLEEVEDLLLNGYHKDLTSMKAIGYKEAIAYLEGNLLLKDSIEKIKQNSRRYAKRQLTWFRRYDFAKWFEVDDYENYENLKSDVVSFIKKELKNI